MQDIDCLARGEACQVLHVLSHMHCSSGLSAADRDACIALIPHVLATLPCGAANSSTRSLVVLFGACVRIAGHEISPATGARTSHKQECSAAAQAALAEYVVPELAHRLNMLAASRPGSEHKTAVQQPNSAAQREPHKAVLAADYAALARELAQAKPTRVQHAQRVLFAFQQVPVWWAVRQCTLADLLTLFSAMASSMLLVPTSISAFQHLCKRLGLALRHQKAVEPFTLLQLLGEFGVIQEQAPDIFIGAIFGKGLDVFAFKNAISDPLQSSLQVRVLQRSLLRYMRTNTYWGNPPGTDLLSHNDTANTALSDMACFLQRLDRNSVPLPMLEKAMVGALALQMRPRPLLRWFSDIACPHIPHLSHTAASALVRLLSYTNPTTGKPACPGLPRDQASALYAHILTAASHRAPKWLPLECHALLLAPDALRIRAPHDAARTVIAQTDWRAGEPGVVARTNSFVDNEAPSGAIGRRLSALGRSKLPNAVVLPPFVQLCTAAPKAKWSQYGVEATIATLRAFIKSGVRDDAMEQVRFALVDACWPAVTQCARGGRACRACLKKVVDTSNNGVPW